MWRILSTRAECWGQEPWQSRVFKTGRLTVDAFSHYMLPQTGEAVLLQFIILQNIDQYHNHQHEFQVERESILYLIWEDNDEAEEWSADVRAYILNT